MFDLMVDGFMTTMEAFFWGIGGVLFTLVAIIIGSLFLFLIIEYMCKRSKRRKRNGM